MQQHPQPQPSQHSAGRSSSPPFLKWAGSKRRLLAQILPHLPFRGRLIEPFLGAGAVFLAADYDRYLLNDANPDLMAVWVALQSSPKRFMEEASALFVDENRSPESYLRIRNEFNTADDRFERAVRFIYLNRFGFNGLCRVNSKGNFNVPYGKPTRLPRFPFDELEAASRKLAAATLTLGGYEAALDEATFGDVVYCDPPYADLSAEAGSFTAYTAGKFGMEDHRGLASACEAAAERGAVVLVSNHDTPVTRELYKGWELYQLKVRRSIAADGSKRGNVGELVAIRRPLASAGCSHR